MRHGGAEAVVAAIRNHMPCAEVVESACKTLRNISAQAANKVDVARAGAIDAVLQALREHPDHEAIQEHGSVGQKARAR